MEFHKGCMEVSLVALEFSWSAIKFQGVSMEFHRGSMEVP